MDAFLLLLERAALHVHTTMCYTAVKGVVSRHEKLLTVPIPLQGPFCKLKFPCAYKSGLISNLSYQET